ncbi:SDR family oxidoreductase [Hydrogenophaga sp. ZJX-1]|uniref:SDR family oxidoreductase n=1 Tax=Hydrogenophaga sp. ZJX-1 TaxID=3404778 RepID=UPI003B27E495
MNLGIEGRRALVFGGSKGMGHACARHLALAGVHVCIAARTESTLIKAARELSHEAGRAVHWVVADITTEEGRNAALDACATPDILINNSDGFPPGDFRDWHPPEWHAALDAMMLGPIEMIRRTVDPMMERRFGRIVNIVSRSVKTPHLELGLSSGARSGLVSFSAALARHTVRYNVTINNLLPGVFATDAQRRHVQKLSQMTGRSFESIWAEREKGNPAGRFGDPDEIGAWCAFMASQHAGFVTGQSVLVDGGDYPGMF